MTQKTEWTPLSAWLSEQLKIRNDMSAREASLGAGLTHSAIASYIRGARPDLTSCHKLADFFGVPKETVLELAGHKDPEPDNRFMRELSYLGAQIPPDKQQLVLALIRSALTTSAREDS